MKNAAIRMRLPGLLKLGFWLCIAIAIVLRRIVALSTPISPTLPPQLAALDAYFATHATLTYIHILSALAFVSLLPLLFWHRTRDSLLLMQAFFSLGLIVGGTALAMSTHAVGGWIERAAILLFDTLFLASLVRAFVAMRRSDHDLKQRWMLRAIAILLGIATTRPVMGVFFATAPRTHLTPQQFFGIAFWIGFSVNTLAVEIWLRHRDRHARHRASVT